MAEVTPVIGITGPRKRALMPRLLVALVTRWYGAKAVQLRPGDPVDFSEFDGIVVTGGHDVDPVLYAAEPEVHPRYDQERDAFESEAIDWAVKHHLPLLGICRGAQLLNVRLGGSLFQELRSRRQKTSNRWTILPLKTLKVCGPSKLARLLHCERCKINSLHNQGIDQLGEGLMVTGRDLDGIVQSVEQPDYPFLLGVQWHPEFLILNRRQRRLFGALVEVARKRTEAAISAAER
ncbi:gamma-glutamyl-gamma-aminobutyrate hydrolase family protein [Marinimicrobium alkaliphilum]|uniref:gamma-glutamyl-gamma-aminobutyrate hydrolase family protein n=1 Tax=Marinimicrobium alkaliphilum TaxID=2202654 RepID=UPI000DB92E8F|nr:type 1 glutamine amidotransferase [Marinimicrobium alkaliphilum]